VGYVATTTVDERGGQRKGMEVVVPVYGNIRCGRSFVCDFKMFYVAKDN